MGKKPFVSKNIKREEKSKKKSKKLFSKFLIKSLILISFFFIQSATCEELTKTDVDNIYKCCRSYIDKNKTEDVKKFSKYLEGRIKQKMEDSSTETEESALKSITLDWLSDNQYKIEQRDKPTLLRASVLFTMFIEKGIMFPKYIVDKMIENKQSINAFFEL